METACRRQWPRIATSFTAWFRTDNEFPEAAWPPTCLCRVLRTLQHYLGTVTQGCGRGGLTLGYSLASPTGTKNGTCSAGRARPTDERTPTLLEAACRRLLVACSARSEVVLPTIAQGGGRSGLTQGYSLASPTGTKALPPTRLRRSSGLCPYAASRKDQRQRPKTDDQGQKPTNNEQ